LIACPVLVAGVSFTLDDGSTILVTENEVERVKAALLEVSATPGAVSCAAQLRHYQLLPASRSVQLTKRESRALRVALDHLPAVQDPGLDGLSASS